MFCNKCPKMANKCPKMAKISTFRLDIGQEAFNCLCLQLEIFRPEKTTQHNQIDEAENNKFLTVVMLHDCIGIKFLVNFVMVFSKASILAPFF